MIAFEVMDMTCGHCVGAITRAVKAVDGDAQVQIDLAAHRVDVSCGHADAVALAAAITDAGYTPTALAAAPAPVPSKAGPRTGGCCCGPESTCAVA